MTEIVKFRDEYEEMQIEITLNLTFISFQTDPGIDGPKNWIREIFEKADQTLVTRADPGPTQADRGP